MTPSLWRFWRLPDLSRRFGFVLLSSAALSACHEQPQSLDVSDVTARCQRWMGADAGSVDFDPQLPTTLREVIWAVDAPTGDTWLLDLRSPAGINGQPARAVAIDQRVWLRTPPSMANSGGFVGVTMQPDARGRLGVQFVGCERSEAWLMNRWAEPLSTTNQDPAGLHVVQRFVPQGWSSGRSSDLVRLESGVVVIARGSDGLRVLDARAPERLPIREIAHVPALPGDDINDVAVLDEHHVVAASVREGLLLFDFSEPAEPVLLDAGFPRPAPRDGHNLFIRDDLVFIAHSSAFHTGWVSALRWQPPDTLQLLWMLDMPAGHDAHDVFVSSNHAYVSSLRGGLYAIELKDPPAIVGHFNNPDTHSAAVLDETEQEALLVLSEEKLGGSLRLLRWSRGDEPRFDLLATYRSPLHRPSEPSSQQLAAASPHKFVCRERSCYIAYYQQGLERLDWSPSHSPELAAWFPTWPLSPSAQRAPFSGATGTALAPPNVWVLDTHGGLYVLSD